MDFSFFTTDNKSGYKTKETWVKKNLPDIYESINEYCGSLGIEMNFKEKLFFYFNKLSKRPTCTTCGGEIKFRDRFDKPYGDFCSLLCINNNKDEMKKRQEKTFSSKYGVNYYTQHKDFITKQRKTKTEKYGDPNFNNVKKSRETKKLRYNDENYVNIEKVKLTNLTKYGSENYSKSNKYKVKIDQNYKNLYPDVNILEINKGSVNITCDICGSESNLTKQLLYERYKRKYVLCTNCNPVGHSSRSGIEKEVCCFLDDINVNYKTNEKLKNKKFEIDILIPDHNLGIEINGLYWHNELHKTDDYHLRKTISCGEEKITLIHIFEDEWLYKKEIVKSILMNKLGLTPKTIYGRKCEIKEINSKVSKQFLENNHIQGDVNSKVNIGLFYDNNLVSLMTFSKGRVIMGGKSNEWELNRFCNLINTKVVGSSSKLLKYFISKYKPEKIVSYSDIRIFDGNMYKTLGFDNISQSRPNYWYVMNDMRYHRFRYRKSILVKEGFDKNKTEKQIMFDRGIYRIYDCGNIRWEWNKK